MKNIFLQGLPGIGKTTLIKKVARKLQEIPMQTCGFYTEELRESHSRIGFDIVTLEGQRGILARKSSETTKYKVGPYEVHLEDFERVALPIFDNKWPLLIIDEIGKMELFSKQFEARIENLITNQDIQLIATIPLKKGPKLVEKIKANPDIHLITVTRENRDELLQEIMLLLQK